MSAQNDRWRRQSPQRNQRHPQARSRDRSAGGGGFNNPTSKQDADRSSFSGNAWGSQKGRGDGQRQSQAQRQSAPPAAAQAGFLEQEHTPVNGFNSREAKNTLKKWYQEANAIGADGKSPLYKPQGDVTTSTASPWGRKPNTMANGQDFWVHLRKQIAALESGKST